MGRKATQRNNGAIERRSTRASTSKDRITTERISPGEVQRTKRRLLTKPNVAAAKRIARQNASGTAPKDDEAIVSAAQRLIPDEPIIVGEREDQAHNEEPKKAASVPEQQQPEADPPSGRPARLAPEQPPEEDGPAPTDAANHQAAVPQEPSNPPDLPPDGIHRPNVAKLQETLFALDDICMQDGQIQAQVEEIGRLLAVIRRKEAEVVQKVRDLQRTRVTVERLYMSRVKLDPSLIGQGEREAPQGAELEPEPEDETRREPTPNKKRSAEEPDADRSHGADGCLPSPKQVRGEQSVHEV